VHIILLAVSLQDFFLVFLQTFFSLSQIFLKEKLIPFWDFFFIRMKKFSR